MTAMNPIPLKKKTDMLKRWLGRRMSHSRKQTLFAPSERKKSLPPYYLRAGATFERARNDQTLETAKILGFHDNEGITHVRFEIRFRHPCSPIEDCEGPKILSIGKFSDLYDITQE